MQRKRSDVPTAPPFIKVGNIKEYITSIHNKKTAVLYTYKDVHWDIDGWADAKKYLPSDFDLVYMRLKREKTIPGWIRGSSWNGLCLKKDDEVVFWKRKEEERDA